MFFLARTILKVTEIYYLWYLLMKCFTEAQGPHQKNDRMGHLSKYLK